MIFVFNIARIFPKINYSFTYVSIYFVLKDMALRKKKIEKQLFSL